MSGFCGSTLRFAIPPSQSPVSTSRYGRGVFSSGKHHLARVFETATSTARLPHHISFATFVPGFTRKFIAFTFKGSDINHIIPQETAGESFHSNEQNCSGPEGVWASSGMHPQGGVFVSTQTVCEFRTQAVQTSAASSNSFFVRGSVVSIEDASDFSRTAEDQRGESDPDGLGCARGLRSAFLLEAGMVVLAYVIWHLWHLAR